MEEQKLPYSLLVDTKGSTRKLWDVPKTLFVLPGRTTYVIDKKGIVRMIFSSSSKFKQHAREALSMIKQLS